MCNVTLPIDNLAWATKTDTIPSPIGNDLSVGPGQSSYVGPSDIHVPPAFGIVKERFQQDRAPKGLIVHVQDLHTHYEAHSNIARIIEHMVNRHAINVILCEAKDSDKGFAYLRPWTSERARKKVAEENLKNGRLTAWEALDLSSDLDLVLQGIEDRDLYVKDMESFLKAEVIREDALAFVDRVRNIVNNVKMHVYSRAQKAFDEKISNYRAERIGIQDYVTYLMDLSQRHGIDGSSLVNLGILIETLDLEGKIDFGKAENGREAIIETLSKGLSESEIQGLLDMSMKFKSNRISQHEFYKYLVNLARDEGIKLEDHPDFYRYTKYIATYHDLDASKLFGEINSLENMLAGKIFAKDDQKRLFGISKNLIILKGLVDFKLTPDEFDYYAQTRGEFDVDDWLDFLKLNSESFGLTLRVPDDSSIIKDNIPILETFYRTAHERDEAFVKNIDEQFANRGLDRAMVMTGGFHTPGVTRRLKDAGYSYVVISPRIETEMDYDKYHDILKDSYNRLRGTSVLGAWNLVDMPNDVLDQILAGGVANIAGASAGAVSAQAGGRVIACVIDGDGVIVDSVRNAWLTDGAKKLESFFELVKLARDGNANAAQLKQLSALIDEGYQIAYPGVEAGTEAEEDDATTHLVVLQREYYVAQLQSLVAEALAGLYGQKAAEPAVQPEAKDEYDEILDRATATQNGLRSRMADIERALSQTMYSVSSPPGPTGEPPAGTPLPPQGPGPTPVFLNLNNLPYLLSVTAARMLRRHLYPDDIAALEEAFQSSGGRIAEVLGSSEGDRTMLWNAGAAGVVPTVGQPGVPVPDSSLAVPRPPIDTLVDLFLNGGDRGRVYVSRILVLQGLLDDDDEETQEEDLIAALSGPDGSDSEIIRDLNYEIARARSAGELDEVTLSDEMEEVARLVLGDGRVRAVAPEITHQGPLKPGDDETLHIIVPDRIGFVATLITLPDDPARRRVEIDIYGAGVTDIISYETGTAEVAQAEIGRAIEAMAPALESISARAQTPGEEDERTAHTQKARDIAATLTNLVNSDIKSLPLQLRISAILADNDVEVDDIAIEAIADQVSSSSLNDVGTSRVMITLLSSVTVIS